MRTFSLIVSTPDGNRFQGQAEALIVRGTEGELAILAGHIPFLTAVKPGPCQLRLPDGTRRTARTEGGLLAVDTAQTTLLCSSFSWAEPEAER